MLKFRVLSIAETDATSAVCWYDRKKTGLGDDFLSALERAYDRIEQERDALPKVVGYEGPHDLRYAKLERFPYQVVVVFRSDETIVVAVSHLSRRPMHWLDRI